jgi:glycosyltransferase involved in cell wall biosynthesis
VSGSGDLPGVVVGVGSEVPPDTDPQRFREKYGIKGRFAIYVGRVDENKGCKDLFWHFERYARATPGGLSLVLVGASILPIPDHPRVRHLGFLPDQDKFDAIAASDVLVMPSYLESLSMVLLEAWALGRPVLANAKCDVLKGQCLRSNAGLYYENGAEFTEALRWIATSSPLVRELGANGRAYYQRHYRWPVVEERYLEMLDRLKGEPDERAGRHRGLEPLPGWIARRQKKIPAAAAVVAQLPQGPSRTGNGD